ncbi:FxSxx-COOH system tetratricopeptide repeat protein [Streptomyces sp. 4.24]|uniref:FxSxx-COOH system tetratricopeptide repeat protein n=1 Tax=Streptomyces tritrimontium TaxID=3406573 RepID=UPI003BB5F824
MSAPVPGLEPPAPARPGGASGPRSVAAGVNGGVISTGDGASIDARTQILPREAFSSPAEVAASAGLNNLPLPASALFFGRDDEMRRLWAAMRGAAAVVTQAVHGLGGVGKSTLALHYAHTHRDQYTLVWWLTASSPDTIETGLGELALRLHPARRSLPDTTTEDHAQWATGWLQAHPGWLLIVDNAEHPDHIAPLIGQLAGGHHLITTRRALGWHHLTTHPIALDVLAPDAAVELLINITGQTGERDRQDAAHLAAELGFLPLALEQAGAYIQHNQTTHARYLAQLASRPARMFATPAGGGAHARTIARIWRITLDTIALTNPHAVDLLSVLAFLAPDNVPRDLLESSAEEDSTTVDEALGLLYSHSMITLGPETVATHRLVQAVARTPDPQTGPGADPHRTPEATATARGRATALLLRALPEAPTTNVGGWSRWQTLIPHVDALMAVTTPDQDEESSAVLLYESSCFLNGQGQLNRAAVYAKRALADRERLLGRDHPDTLATRNHLAYVHRSAGELERAVELFEQTLADRGAVLGEDHPDTLTTRHYLAYTHQLAGDLDRAVELFEQTLADRETVLGDDHPDTLRSLNHLGYALQTAGDYTRAIPLHERALADRERVLGGDHPDTLATRNDLAYAYRSTGDLDRVIELFERALADRERVLGGDHPDTLATRNDLAHAYESAGDLDRAVPLYEQTLADRVRVLSGDHPDIIASRNNLAGAYQMAGDLDRAVPLYEETLASALRCLGGGSPTTRTVRGNLDDARLARATGSSAAHRYRHLA